MLSVIRLNAVMLNVVAPIFSFESLNGKIRSIANKSAQWLFQHFWKFEWKVLFKSISRKFSSLVVKIGQCSPSLLFPSKAGDL
jgi:hypothetical protein